MNSDIIETVAKALFVDRGYSEDQWINGGKRTEYMRRRYRYQAIAAIKSMRSIPDIFYSKLDALGVRVKWNGMSKEEASSIWRAMIDNITR